MIKKQDRTFARKAVDLERKYDFEQNFGDAKNQAASAQRTANEALEVASGLDGEINKANERIDKLVIDNTVKHEWEGTTLKITTSSGTSSSDLKGEKGDKGDNGVNGVDGKDGKSAYDYAKDGGYTGTEEEFLLKLATDFLALAGGIMTGEIKIGQGDGKGIQLGTNGRINATTPEGSTTATVCGVIGGNAIFGHSSFNATLRGKAVRPTYNGANMALKSDVDTLITVSSEDLEAGVSPLASGKLYFVYEEN